MAHYALILLVAAVAESACHWLKCVQCRLTLNTQCWPTLTLC